MSDPTVEIMCSEALETALKRVAAHGYLRGDELKEIQILGSEVTRARALQRFNNDRQIRLHLPVSR